MTITTLGSKQVWQSPDGQRTLFEIVFTSDQHMGKQLKAQTYSRRLAEEGFIGEVESYVKSDNRGVPQTFLKQPQREGFSNSQQPNNMVPAATPNEKQNPASWPTRFSKETTSRAMYTSYAKDIAVVLQETTGFVEDKFLAIIKMIAKGGDYLFDNAALGIGIDKDVEESLEGRGRIEQVMGRTETLPKNSDPFNGAESL